MHSTAEKILLRLLRTTALLFCTASATLAGCSGNGPPRPVASSVRLVPSRTDLDRETIARDSRYILRANQSLPISVPARAKLEIAFGISDAGWETGSGRVDFSVSFRTDGNSHTLLERGLDVGDKGDNRWQDAVLDLGPFSGQRGTLELQAKPSGSVGEGEVLWTDPRLTTPGAPAGTNIILVSVDTLRSDHLGCYGHPQPTSPNIDRMASEGALFRQLVASSCWTEPSHASMLSGLDPSRHGAVVFAYFRPVSRDLNMLAERLWDAGYETAGFTGGGFVSGSLGFDQGYDRYWDNPESKGAGDTLQRSLDMAKPWMEQRHGRRFFVFLHTYQVHMPYAPPPPYDTLFDPGYQGPDARRFTLGDGRLLLSKGEFPPRTIRHMKALYDGEIRAMDAAVGDLLGFLKDSGLTQNTCVLFTSDHGEEFGEHGGLFHQQAKLYEELIRVPLILWCPGKIPAGRVVESPVSHTDLVPTILELAGAPPATDIDGRSLVPLLRGEPGADDRMTISEVDGSIIKKKGTVRAIRSASYKLIDSSIDDSEQLYDLRADPGEKHDIHASRPDVVSELRAAAAQQRSVPTLTPGTAMTPDDALRERLRALGYTE